MKKIIYLLLIVPTWCLAQSPKITEVNHGIYTAWVTSEEPNNQSITGVTSGLSNIILNSSTDTIQIDNEIWFGIKYKVESTKLQTADIEIVWIYPKPITNESGKEFKDLHNQKTRTVGLEYFTVYQMTEKYEQVPGKWTLQIWHKKKKLLEHFFYVVEK